jgi:hypothetical protein
LEVRKGSLEPAREQGQGTGARMPAELFKL